MSESGSIEFPPAKIEKTPDIPSAPQVEFWEHLASSEIPHQPRNDVAIAFGQGPVQDEATKRQAEEIARAHGVDVQVEINTWGRTTGVVMGYLRRRNEYREGFFSGGKTGGTPYASEGALMKDAATTLFPESFDKNQAHTEDASTNTLENFSLTLNEIDRLKAQGDQSFDKFAFVGSHFHLPRLRILAQLYNIPNIQVFSSESVITTMMHDQTLKEDEIEKIANYLIPDRDTSIPSRRAVLNWVDKRTNIPDTDLNRTDPTADYYSYVLNKGEVSPDGTKQKAPYTPYEKELAIRPTSREGTTYASRMRNEARFSEGLLSLPANWIGYLSDIKNDARLRDILANLKNLNFPKYDEFVSNTLAFPANYDPKNIDLADFRLKVAQYKNKPYREFVHLENYNDQNPYLEKNPEKIKQIQEAAEKVFRPSETPPKDSE